ncbi:metallophosphoesterase family protein [Asanoa hainanensis]|nr:metallophosphoesterase [Asanoa hainanensis]
MATRRPRPRTMDPIELGFQPRRPVPWLGPLLLLSTGVRTLLAILFGAYLDKRELQNSLPGDVIQEPGTDGELWLDYVADLGDGFNSTYSVAYLLAQPELELGGQTLPRGQVLVMGGDQVYPTASAPDYEDRCKGPYTAALPCPPASAPQPTLYAVPGNHDWYDGLTAFLRLFARQRDASLGGWRTKQSRSYFAVKLPADWWLLALDEQFGAYVDDPQLNYFEAAAREFGPDDKIILAVPEPSWVKAALEKSPEAYDAVDYFIRTIIAPTGARVRLMLSGDLHHYARYSGVDRELVTCGGGGAYLYPTHELPDEITVPPPDTLSRRSSQSRPYHLTATYPDKPTSRRLGWGVFGRLPSRNAGFATLIGGLQTLLMLSMAGIATQQRNETGLRLFSIPLVTMLVITLLGAAFFAKPPTAVGKRSLRHWFLGGGHGLAQIGLAALGTWLWLMTPFPDWPWPFSLLIAIAVYGPLAGLVGSQLVALYLLVAGHFGVNINELYAGQGIDDVKSFLRLHIAADGALTVYPVAVDRICREWRPNPTAPDERPWLEPAQSLIYRAADEPFVLR